VGSSCGASWPLPCAAALKRFLPRRRRGCDICRADAGGPAHARTDTDGAAPTCLPGRPAILPTSQRDIGIVIIAIIRASLMVKLALAGLLIGSGFVGSAAISAPPARASLQTLEATAVSAARETRTSRRSGSSTSQYRLTLRPGPAGQEEIRLAVPALEAAESDIRAAVGKRVRVEFAGDDDVYALAVGGREIVRYDSTAERRRLGYRQYQVDGIAILGGSLVLLLVGGALTWRRLSRAAAAA
jgi:hypothetical protein